MKKLSIPKGYTVIELLIIITILGILTSVGITSYTSFNANQSVQNAASDVINVLTTAKSRSTSQVKPAQCVGRTLSAYQVNVTILASQYTLSVICGGSTYLLSTQHLHSPIIFASGSTTVMRFAVSSGTLTNPATVIVSGYGKTKTVTVTRTGTIMTN